MSQEFEMTGVKVRLGVSDIIIRVFGYILITFYALACIFPFLIIIGTSFTNESVIMIISHIILTQLRFLLTLFKFYAHAQSLSRV